MQKDFPKKNDLYFTLVNLYLKQNQYDKARTALEMAIRTNPSYATAHENLGDVYARLAGQAYSKALQLDGGNTAVPPKLAFIRDMFAPSGNPSKTSKPAPVATPAPSPAAAPAPAPVAAASSVPSVATASAPATPSVAAVTVAPAPAPAPAPAAPKTPSADNSAKDVEQAVEKWAKAWAAKDMTSYLGAYGKDFQPPGKMSRKEWEKQRRDRIVGKSTIQVKISQLRVQIEGDRAQARFRQDYKADALSVSSRKTLHLNKVGGQWHIVKESTGS